MRTYLRVLILLICATAICCRQGNTANTSTGETITPAPFADISDPNQALALGDQLLEENETERAIDAYLRATELDPDLAEAWFKLGIAYSLIEKEQALAARSDANAPGDANAQKTSRTNSEKAFRRAIEAYKKIIAKNPDDDAAFFNLGRAYNKINADEDAAKALKQAVRLKPDSSEYLTELGAILIKLAQYHEAIPPLKKALELDPDNSLAADLLDDAEAGRARIDYAGPKKDTANSNVNVNSNVNGNVNANIGVKPSPTVKPTEKPDVRPTQKPANRPE